MSVRKNTELSHSRYAAKRLNTQSFSSNSVTQQDLEFNAKLDMLIQNAEREAKKSHSKLLYAKKRQSQLQKSNIQSRQSLKNQLNQKMRISQSNLQKIRKQQQSKRSTRSKFEGSTRSRIQSMQKIMLEESIKKSKEQRTQTQKFFQEKRRKQVDKNKKIQKMYQDSYSQSFYQNTNTSTQYSSHKQNSKSRVRKLPNVLQVSQQVIDQKQRAKKLIEKQKEARYLNEYIQKLEEINAVRSKSHKPVEPPHQNFPKIINQQQNNQKSRYKAVSHSTSPTKNAINNRVSFSQIYAKKLQEKLDKVEAMHSLSLQHGQMILKQNQKITIKNKQQKIIKDTVNEVKRRCHMKYMRIFMKK